jgi:hypothetical protein
VGRFLVEAKQSSGVHVRDDLMANADDCVVAWSAPSQGGLLFTSAVAAVPLRDGKAFGKSLQAMWEQMTNVAPNKAGERAKGRALSWHEAYLEHFEHHGCKVWWVDLIDHNVPFALSWTSTAGHFLFGLQPQPLRSAIDASQQPDFDHALARQPVVARRGKATAMLYLDVHGILAQAYPPLLLLLQAGSLGWQRDGFDFDLADVPRLQALLPHVGPELVTFEPTQDGCLVTRRGSLPVLDPLLVGCGMACLLAID